MSGRGSRIEALSLHTHQIGNVLPSHLIVQCEFVISSEPGGRSIRDSNLAIFNVSDSNLPMLRLRRDAEAIG
jgi:hypothetical protein